MSIYGTTLDRVPKRLIRMNSTSMAIFLICSCVILLASNIGSQIGSNYILYSTANAQLEDREEVRKEQKAVAVEEEAAVINSNKFSVTLDRAHFIPLPNK